ncbi:TPA: DUF551 domain-containing protein [Klebsiella pneumoniae]|nr:DUF551 domain-containing protein [Klebsiella pneumoniae]HCD2577177.1 DUF551 domain-containing protein [Klebsiella pneumoniae]
MTKSTITRERLAKIKSWRETYGAGSNVMLPAEEAEELACMALAAMDSEPDCKERKLFCSTDTARMRKTISFSTGTGDAPLYRHAQAAPVVPDEKDKTVDADDHPLLWSFNEGWNACRAAVLKAQPQNAPQNIPEIIPGWIPVSEHLPKEKGVYQVWNGKYVDNVPFWFGSFQSLHSELITHWMPLPAEPQEVKSES